MANNSGVQQTQLYQSQIIKPMCNDCNITFDSAVSMDIHMRYTHKDAFNKWSSSSTSSTSSGNTEETNNNNTKTSGIKREFSIKTISSSSDNTDKKSPTPDNNMFGHPPTPQSYQSASSPYQNQDNNTYSPNFQNYPIKTERIPSPNFQNFQNYSETYYPTMIDPSQNYQEYPVHKNSTYRYHPYQQQQSYEHPSQAQVSSSSPAFPPQPTPSPSPKTCDKCGTVCDSASQLIEHINISHPPTPAPHLSAFQTNQHYIYDTQVKLEDETQSEILDLDSHKVHQVFQEDDKRQENPHSVSALIASNWSSQNKLQFQDQRLFINNLQEQKMYQTHPEFMSNGVNTTTQEPNFRSYEHLQGQNPTAAPVIQNNVVPSPQNPPQPAPPAPPSTTKSASWKSNEARRPKTYNCTACNKWFTSSGHLKRHYNTTLHKNAVKSSGQPDPATLPISAHHHPARDAPSREDRTSNSPNEDSREDQYLQPTSNGPYERQPPVPPNIHQPSMVSLNLTNSNGSPPNGEAGPSILDSRGLLSLSANPNTTTNGGFNMVQPAPPPPPTHMMHMDANHQYQMYPNELAPHVSQDIAVINNHLTTTGELHQFIDNSITTQEIQQPLPSFAQIHRGLLLFNDGNVGGGGAVTTPYSINFNNNYENIETHKYFKNELKLTVLTPNFNYQNELVNMSNNMQCVLQSPTIKDIEYIEQDEQQYQQMNPITESDEDEKLAADDLKLDIQPNSPEKAHTKRNLTKTGSPRVTSTTTNNNLSDKHKCYDCDKYFNKACYLTQHNKTFHNGEKPYKCDKCGKRFANENVYETHLRKHMGDKPHKCEICPKQFNHKTDLRRHMCLHTGIKPYRCEACGKGFIRKDHMLKHSETHTRKAQLKGTA